MSDRPVAAPSGETLYENAPCGLVLTAADGTILRVNTTFCEWIGSTAAQLVNGRRVQDLFTPGGKIYHQTHWQPLLQIQGAAAEIELEIAGSDGQPIPMILNAVRRQHDGETRHEIAFFVATDRHKYERELRHARGELRALNERLSEADRRKDEFLATLAHELRNPLAPIHNVLHLMRTEDLDEDQREWSLAVLDRQVQQMARLVEDLLDISRIAQGKIELRRTRIDLTGILRASAEAARPLFEATGHELTFDLPGERLPIDADETRLAQVLQNLLNNAAKFTPKGGRVHLSARRSDDWAIFSVRDSGIGIAPEHLSSVFNMFSQIDESRDYAHGGLGIGLALVHVLVKLHGGTITVESDGVGHGSEFVVRLPLISASDAHVETAPESGRAVSS